MAEAADQIRELQAEIAALKVRVSALESRALIAPEPVRAQPHLESRFGLTFVNRVGALTLAIGILFFFKYAADNQWIGPWGRVLIGLGVGIALLIGASYLHKRDQRVFSQGLAGCGMAAIYVALYAAFAYYELIPELLGFALIAAACLVVISLSVRLGNSAVAALGFIGAFLALVLLRRLSSNAFFDLIYLLLIDGAALAISVRQGWPLLTPVNALWAIAAGAHLLHPGWFAALALLLGVMHMSVWICVGARIRPNHWPYITGHVAFVLALLRLVSTFSRNLEVTFAAASIALALYGIAILAFGLARRSGIDRALGLIFLGAVIAKLYVWDVWQLKYAARITAFVVLGVLLLAASYIYSRWRSRTSS
ncbi:MAG: DUF2339 domain-containing protein [Acidobacteriaceae bacterium]|nr:DUF2339 domain-containing protein [Acidobacteriaceae bacterium]